MVENNENVKKVLEVTSLLFVMILLFSYIGWYLNYDGFIIVGDIDLPQIVIFPMCFVLLLINMSLFGGFVLREYSLKILRYSIPLTLIEVVRALWLPSIPFYVTLGIVPTIIFLFSSIPRKSLKRTLWSLIIINAAILGHQYVVSQITQTTLSYGVSIYTMLRLSVDSILLLVLFYSLGGVKYANLSKGQDIERQKG